MRWQRLELATSELKALKPDVILFQEVNIAAGVPKKLQKLLPGYHMNLTARDGKHSHLGQAVMSRTKPSATKDIRLNQNRLAQSVSLKLNGRALNILNVHLYFSPFVDSPRLRQIKKLLDLKPAPDIIAGDFNARPNAKSIKMLKHRYRSTYEIVHGHEPQRTFPSGVWLGGGPRHHLRHNALKSVGLIKDKKWQPAGVTVDYIFARKNLNIISSRLILDAPSKKDPKLYASDHFGLLAEFSL